VLEFEFTYQKVEKTHRALKRGLRDEWDFFTTLEQGACHIFINWEVNLCKGLIAWVILYGVLANSINKVNFHRVAGVLTPELFEIESTEWYVTPEHWVDLLERLRHDRHLVIVAAHRARHIQKWTDLSQSTLLGLVHGNWLKKRAPFWVFDIACIWTCHILLSWSP
jgi:hypothetical protein